MFSRLQIGARIALGLLLAVAIGSETASAWEAAHGDRDNTGFADVPTAPAKKAPITIPGLGKFAPGAGPVIAPDGTVYLGTLEGKLIALHADGSKFWSRDITRGQAIVASPVISSDGSIYVIGVKKVTDHRVDPPRIRADSMLHIFNSGGGWIGQIPFPEHDPRGPLAMAPPNIWQSVGREAIITPVIYRHSHGGGYHTRLIAFSTSGALLDDQVISTFDNTVHGGSGRPLFADAYCLVPVVGWATCQWLGDFDEGTANGASVPPPPGVGIFTFAGGGAPFILASDHYKDLVGYTFSGRRFNEAFRVHIEDHFMRSSPVILPNGRTLIGIEDIKRDDIGAEGISGQGGVLFAGPNGIKVPPISGLSGLYASPTRMADGRVALVGAFRQLTILQGAEIAATLEIPGQSIASAAASRSHLFVSTTDAFLTFDANTLAEVGRIDWVGGGLNPPAIGPKGHVYAIASDILFVFPPPLQAPVGAGSVANPLGQPVATNPAQPVVTSTPRQKAYTPPLTVNGNRLFACEELDGDDCGKGDYKAIAKAFCEKQGYVIADDIDVDSKKVKAETLEGQFCSKNKCKVFDTITCEM